LNNTEKIALVTGGFDPLHSGHIAYLQETKKLFGQVIVGLNSDDWLVRKKGKAFMPFVERKIIVENLNCVTTCIGFNDLDNSAKDAIHQVRKMFPKSTIIFANGGDRTSDNIPEMDISDKNVEFVFGIGGTNKTNSSSWILQEWKMPKTDRDWGFYRVLYETTNTKVKELTINSNKSLSMQRHKDRNEYWHIVDGKCMIDGKILEQHDYYYINKMQWHQLINPYEVPCRIIEIQYGTQCIEEDIERK